MITLFSRWFLYLIISINTFLFLKLNKNIDYFNNFISLNERNYYNKQKIIEKKENNSINDKHNSFVYKNNLKKNYAIYKLANMIIVDKFNFIIFLYSEKKINISKYNDIVNYIFENDFKSIEEIINSIISKNNLKLSVKPKLLKTLSIVLFQLINRNVDDIKIEKSIDVWIDSNSNYVSKIIHKDEIKQIFNYVKLLLILKKIF